ncbi:hypothetical protein SAMN05192529_11524 [Arachidicoccus rhizosphaerae]|jgi:hypothetical protein|uniref:Uncharacterized protein n=1 Tax=Arachidicoccus rhizosphaerae TaxID=551991 RepID=A0A1H4AJ63_9BACT|nr:hypothetical protein [Arachidicoccus rhizosphaerae]SEA36029.1 hypothetical protein SAMN05192529_11524 [Arachidicoccus rhizosphaerae]
MKSIFRKNEQLKDQVSKLIQRHLDRALRFQLARSLCDNSNIKTLLEQGMQQSYYFADHLQTALKMQGLTIIVKPSWSGAFFRGWMTLNVGLSHRKSYSLIRRVLSSEKMLNLSYKLLCDNTYLQYAYPLLRSTFQKQYFIIKDYMNLLEETIEGLKDITRAKEDELQNLSDSPEYVEILKDQDHIDFMLTEKLLNVIPKSPSGAF